MTHIVLQLSKVSVRQFDYVEDGVSTKTAANMWFGVIGA